VPRSARRIVALALAAALTGPALASFSVTGWSVARWPAAAGGDGALRALVVVDRAWSWGEAADLAASLGASLAPARASAELGFLELLCVAADAPAGVFDCAGPWIGGARAAGTADSATGWQWADGSAVASFGWARGRPAQSELLAAALVLDGVDGPNGRWFDALPEPAAGVSTRSALMLFAAFTDCNGNDRPDTLEIAADPALDADGDGLLDDCGRRDRADINGDGRVDAADLALVLNAWGSEDAAADVDGSGRVDAADLSAVLSAWAPGA
jgi:hypothetical protein